jgi:hypothetical protein
MAKLNLLDEMFSDVAGDPVAQADRFTAYKSASAASEAETMAGRVRVDMVPDGEGRNFQILRKAPGGYDEVQAQFAEITKAIGGLGAAAPAELQALLGNVGQYITKDWTPTNPISGNMYPYDLIPLARQLWPRDTPLRNTIPRDEGQGGAKEFMRILSVSNAGVPGGAADQLIGFNSQTTTSNWGSAPVVLNRPPKIAYTGDRKSVLYMEMGVSDAASFASYFKGLGFDNQRTLSRTAALWAHLLGEERLDLFGRGTAAGYLGSVSAPTGVTATGGASGGFIPDASYFVYTAAYTGTGYSAVSTVANTGALAGGNDNTITVAITGEPTGALAYGIWIGTTTGIANAKFQGNFAGNPILLTTYNAAGAVTAGTDSSANANVYDGIMTVASGADTGYFKRVNAPWNTTVPGKEIDDMLTAMYVNFAARPDELWMDGVSRSRLGELMRTGGSTGSGYRTNIVTGMTGATMGVTVTGFANPNTGQVLDMHTHRFMPVGTCLARSTSVPYPDARVAAPSTKFNVQDYMAIEWPLLQMSYDVSTYQIGTLVHQAIMLYGLLVGIQ